MKLTPSQEALLLDAYRIGRHERVTRRDSAKALRSRALADVQWIGMWFYQIQLTPSGIELAKKLLDEG